MCPEGNLCYEVWLGDSTQPAIQPYESGCASVSQAILYGSGVTSISEVFQIEVCNVDGCNAIGTETEFNPEIECYDEEDYDTAEAFPIRDDSICDAADVECIECVFCEYFTDDATFTSSTVDPCSENPVRKFYKYSDGKLGRVENFCGMRIIKEQSTYGWKYRVKVRFPKTNP